MVKHCLFIGGCKDRQVLGVHDNPHELRMTDWSMYHPIHVTYKRVTLCDADAQEHVVYVLQGMENQTLTHLIQGYSDG